VASSFLEQTMAYNRKDKFFRQAQQEGFAARSIYKLEAIDERFSIIRGGDYVLDLGCSPGSWLQYIEQVVGTSGRVVGIDLKPVRARLKPSTKIVLGDAFKVPLVTLSPSKRRFDVVCSDMAPSTTGVRSVDQARSADLVERTLDICDALLAPGGHWVAKGFQGQELDDLAPRIKASFERFERLRPPATRKHSFEVFLIGLGFRGAGSSTDPKGAEDGGWMPAL
jgi:23S rRNA (uridine2552-2'-O)-methyltransferase